MPKFGDPTRDKDERHNMWCCGNLISLHQSFLFKSRSYKVILSYYKFYSTGTEILNASKSEGDFFIIPKIHSPLIYYNMNYNKFTKFLV